MLTFRVATAALIAALITACQSTPPVVEADRSEVELREAVVETVDLESRQVLLKAPDGQLFTVVAGPEVRNLAQVNPSDRVEIAYYEAVALKMAADGDSGGVAITAAERAEAGQKPSAGAARAANMVVEFLDYNSDTAVATFIGPDNIVHRTEVHPKMRAFAEARKPGERVEVSIEQALAVSVTPVGG